MGMLPNPGMDEHHLRIWLQTPGLDPMVKEGIEWFLEERKLLLEDQQYLKDLEKDSAEEITGLEKDLKEAKDRLKRAREIYLEIKKAWKGPWPKAWNKPGEEYKT